MHPILRNTLGLIAGIVVGGVVNGAIVSLGAVVIPPPEGMDPNDAESIKAHMHLFEFKHFVAPWLAHALGTLVGAFLAVKIAATYKLVWAMVIGGLFLMGGIAMVAMVGGPLTFIIPDLGLAYIPMALIAWKLGKRK